MITIMTVPPCIKIAVLKTGWYKASLLVIAVTNKIVDI
jgi:hypothetical protein